MSNYKAKAILKSDFKKIKEEDVMFITNPGRMGDEDGITFVVNQNDKYTIYRINGLMYPKQEIEEKEQITLDDALNQFPKWQETWKHGGEKDYKGKYKYIYMGFGNGLSVDNSIYSEFEPFLNQLVEEYLSNKEDKESLQYAAIYNVWEKALLEMIENKSTSQKD